MTAFRKYPLFAAALVACAALAAGEGWCIYERATAAKAAARRLEAKRAQLGELATKVPPPTRDVAQAIAADLARAQQALAAMQGELRGRGVAAERMKAKAPAARTDAYFDLATYVERMRELARKNDVDVRPDAARFGFALHANEAPDAEHLEPVFRQRQVAQYLLESLLDARPKALLAVKREPPLTRKEREDRAAAALAAANGTPPEATPPPEPTEAGPDFFALDPHVSVRAPGFVDTTGFRLVFIGETNSLRTLLNKLASFDLPVLVREVEVEPATAEEAAIVTTSEENPVVDATPPPASVVLTLNGAVAAKPAAARPRVTSLTAPIVAKPWSRFTVTVEYIELVPARDPAAPPAS